MLQIDELFSDCLFPSGSPRYVKSICFTQWGNWAWLSQLEPTVDIHRGPVEGETMRFPEIPTYLGQNRLLFFMLDSENVLTRMDSAGTFKQLLNLLIYNGPAVLNTKRTWNNSQFALQVQACLINWSSQRRLNQSEKQQVLKRKMTVRVKPYLIYLKSICLWFFFHQHLLLMYVCTPVMQWKRSYMDNDVGCNTVYNSKKLETISMIIVEDW